MIPTGPANSPGAWIQTSNFRLACQRSHRSCFTKRPLCEAPRYEKRVARLLAQARTFNLVTRILNPRVIVHRSNWKYYIKGITNNDSVCLTEQSLRVHIVIETCATFLTISGVADNVYTVQTALLIVSATTCTCLLLYVTCFFLFFLRGFLSRSTD